MVNNRIFSKIYKIHFKQLKNLSVVHRKLFICFAGVPCSGKTRLVKILEERYKGVRISNDDLREITFKLFPKKSADERQEILQNYFRWLLINWKQRNNLIILDRGIERRYFEIKKIASEKSFGLFVIKLKVPKRVLLKRIKEKDFQRFTNHFEDVKRWVREFKEFDKNVEGNFIIRNNSKKDLKKLFKRLDEIISAS